MITYWHNPRCSKSRAGLALLEEAGADLTLRLYLEDRPTSAELRDVLGKLGLSPIDMMRVKEPAFKALNLARDSDDATLIDAMTQEPKLIERPIAIRDDRAVIGRPTEALRTLL